MTQSVIQSYPPLYNSMQLSFLNLQLGFEGTFFPFITEFEYNDTNDIAEARGTSPFSMGTTVGDYKASGSISIQKLFAEKFYALLAKRSPSGNSLYDAIFDFTAQYQMKVPPGLPKPDVITDKILGIRLTGGGDTMTAGNGVLVVKHSYYCGLIIRNGRYPLDGLQT